MGERPPPRQIRRFRNRPRDSRRRRLLAVPLLGRTTALPSGKCSHDGSCARRMVPFRRWHVDLCAVAERNVGQHGFDGSRRAVVHAIQRRSIVTNPQHPFQRTGLPQCRLYSSVERT